MKKGLNKIWIYGMVFLLSIAAYSFCTYASEEEEETIMELDLSGLESDDTYCLNGIEWGSEVEDVEKQLGISLSLFEPSIPTYYRTKTKASLFGRTGRFDFEFRPGLEVISVTFQADEGEDLSEFLDAVIEELEKHYGECEMTQSEIARWYRSYRWFNLDESENGSSIQVQTEIEGHKDYGNIAMVTLYIGTIHSREAQDTVENNAG